MPDVTGRERSWSRVFGVQGSWLNIAENELSALTTQCLARRIGKMQELRRQVAAWEGQRNQATVRVNGRFTIDRARERLRRVYPQIQN